MSELLEKYLIERLQFLEADYQAKHCFDVIDDKLAEVLAKKISNNLVANITQNKEKVGSTPASEKLTWQFKNGKIYELEWWDKERGILGFKEGIFESAINETKPYDRVWAKSDLKVKLEKWWDENAPDELKDRFDYISIPNFHNVFGPNHSWCKYVRDRDKYQFEYFKDYKNRVKFLRDDEWDEDTPKNERYSRFYWLRSTSQNRTYDFVCVYSSGNVNYDGASSTYGVVLPFLHLREANSKEIGE